MTRRLPTYTPERLDEAIARTVDATGWTSRELIADAAAEYLTHGSADDIALEHARQKLIERLG